MNRPWMPLYIADYRADTAHLGAAEHGAYLLLIMHYWQTGGLPAEDVPLARIACMTPAEWRKTKTVISAFFTSDWKHKRIDTELAKAADISSKRRASAEQRHSNRNANAQQLDTHAGASSQPQLQTQERKPDAPSGAVPNGNGEGAPSEDDQKREYYRRFQQVWGAKNSGAMATNLLKAKGSTAKARAAVESASEAANPKEYIGAIIRGKAEDARGERGVDWW